MIVPRPITGQPETTFCFFFALIRIHSDPVVNGAPPQIAVLKSHPDVLIWIHHHQFYCIEICCGRALAFVVLCDASSDSVEVTLLEEITGDEPPSKMNLPAASL